MKKILWSALLFWCVFFPGKVRADPSKNNDAEKDPYYLRRDLKLRIKVPLPTNNPELADILQRLRDATGLNMILADNLIYHEPVMGKLQLGKSGDLWAWQVMEWVAGRQMENGRWEKTDTGYRLEGTSLALKIPESNGFYPKVVIGSILLLGLVGAFLLRNRFVKKPSEPAAKILAPKK